MFCPKIFISCAHFDLYDIFLAMMHIFFSNFLAFRRPNCLYLFTSFGKMLICSHENWNVCLHKNFILYCSIYRFFVSDSKGSAFFHFFPHTRHYNTVCHVVNHEQLQICLKITPYMPKKAESSPPIQCRSYSVGSWPLYLSVWWSDLLYASGVTVGKSWDRGKL